MVLSWGLSCSCGEMVAKASDISEALTSLRLSPSRRVADGDCGSASAVAATWSMASPRGLSFLLTWQSVLRAFQEQKQKLYSRSLKNHTHRAEEDTNVCLNSSRDVRSHCNNSTPGG